MPEGKKITGFAAGAAMLMLILDGKTALTGAAEGIDLCIRTVIPALFPFFVLSPLLMGSISPSWLQPVGNWLGLSPGTEGLLLVGFLGGYPAGAQAVGTAFQDGALSRTQAERLLSFCSNAGPSFLFGMVAPLFSTPLAPWVLWLIQIGSAILVSKTLPPTYGDKQKEITFPAVTLSQALARAVKTMGIVCGWVVLLRIVICFLQRWLLWLLPETIQIVMCGILELSNGCCMLADLESEGLRFIICAGLLSFGGLCVAMQTSSVICGLSLKPYLRGKLLQTLFSLALAAIFTYGIPTVVRALLILSGCAVFLILRPGKQKNNSSIPRTSVV